MNFFALNLKAFRKVGLLLFLVGAISTQIDQSISFQVEEALRNPQGMNSAVYFYGFLSLICSLFFPIVMMLFSLWALRSAAQPAAIDSGWGRVSHFFKHYLSPMVIETLRAWGKILLWSLLLIIPGLIRYITYVMVPFVVVQSDAYERGQQDALETSTRVFKRKWLSILGLILLFHLMIPLLLTVFFDEYRLLNQTPLASLGLSLLDAYLFLIAAQCFLLVFQKGLTETSHEPAL